MVYFVYIYSVVGELIWPNSPDEEMVTDDDWQRISVELVGKTPDQADFEIVFEGVIG